MTETICLPRFPGKGRPWKEVRAQYDRDNEVFCKEILKINTDGKAGSPSVVVNGNGNTGDKAADNTGGNTDNTADNTCDKVG
jgi:hypothetical protein